MPHVVIIGGGFGGLSAAKGFRRAPVCVTVIDRSNHHLFQPLLYQVATAGLSPADIAVPIRSILRKQRNTDVLMGEVQGIDLVGKTVSLPDQQIHYDYLIVATGARHSYFGHEEWQVFAPSLKSIPDATKIRQRILIAFEAAEMESDSSKRQELLTFVIVGGGPTGVEMAGSIAELSHFALARDFRRADPRCTRIILIEAGPRILASFPEQLSEKARAELLKWGVEVQTGVRVEQIDAEGVTVNGKKVITKNVIWAAGVKASPAGTWLNVPTDHTGRVIVQGDLSVPGHPEVFVIGDTSCLIRNGKPLPGLAPVAMQQGRFVASVVDKRVKEKTAPRLFNYVDKGNLSTVGRSFAVVDFGKLRLSGLLAWLIWIVVHIYYLIGFRSRILTILEWAWAYFTFQRGARIITSEESAEA